MRQKNIIDQEVSDFVKEYAWKLPSNYVGETFDGYCVVIGKHRDSDTLSVSNFEVAKEMLERVLSAQPDADPDDLRFECASHWAVGYVETILVKATNIELVREAASIRKALDNYPVLDDEDFSEREWEERQETISLYTGRWMTEIGRELDPDLDKDEYTQEQFDDLETLCVFLYEEDCLYRGQEDAWARTEHVSIHELEYQFKNRWGYFSTILRKRLNKQKRA